MENKNSKYTMPNFIYSCPIAHRGLWGNGVIENSLTAYKKAFFKEIPIEIDLYLTKDGKIVSFHDEDLYRMTKVKGKIYEKNYNEIKKLFLVDENGNFSKEKIPTLNEIIKENFNNTPILIEIKNQPKGKELIKKVVEILKKVKFPFALQSFNPFYLMKIKKLAPSFTIGVLGTAKKETESFVKNFIIKNMPFNFLFKPRFISYNSEGFPLKKSKIKNKKVLCWTVTTISEYNKIKDCCDNVIFEKIDFEKLKK